MVNLPWTEAEDQFLFEQIQAWGPKWSRVAALLRHRTDIEVKARWMQKFNDSVPMLPRTRRIESEAKPLAPAESDSTNDIREDRSFGGEIPSETSLIGIFSIRSPGGADWEIQLHPKRDS
jgi:hypothetical protein